MDLKELRERLVKMVAESKKAAYGYYEVEGSMVTARENAFEAVIDMIDEEEENDRITELQFLKDKKFDPTKIGIALLEKHGYKVSCYSSGSVFVRDPLTLDIVYWREGV